MGMCAPPPPRRLDDWQMGRQEISQLISELLVFPWHPFSRWSQRLQISHWKKEEKKQCIMFHSHVITVPNTAVCLLASHVFRVTRSVSDLCDHFLVMGSSEALRELTSHVTGAWHIDQLLLSYPLSISLSLCGLDFVPFWLQIIQGWAGLYAFRVWRGQVRLSQHFADLVLYKCTQVEENSRGGELQDRAYI